MIHITMSVIIDFYQSSGNDINKKVLKKFLNKILKSLDIDVSSSLDIYLSIAFVGDVRMKRLNKELRNKDGTTDVLSFGNLKSYKNDQDLWGEIIVSYPQALKQSKRYNHSIEKEIQILLVHGILHLLGYLHNTKKQFEIMQAKERELIGEGLIGR